MSLSFSNFVHLMGKAGKDVELKTFESGIQKASVSLATESYTLNKEGEKIKNTEWHNLIVWGKPALRFAESVKKGNDVAIQGTIRSRSYTDKSGVSRSICEILVTNFYKISRNQLENHEGAEINEGAKETLPF